MGVPSVLASSWAGECGNMKVLSDEFRLMEVYDRGGDAVAAALTMAKSPPSREHMREQRNMLLKSLDYIPGVIEGHIRDLKGGKHV
jgi:hypothetical protein